MIEIQESTDDRVLEVKIIENATETDVEKFLPVLETHLSETTDARMLLMLEGIDDWSEVVGLWGDLSLDDEYVDQFSRVALVGEASWKGWLTNMIENLVDIDLKYFGHPDITHAREWVGQ